MKRFFIALSVALAISFSAAAQQITRFGVVDTAKVYQAYFRTSAPMRSYDSKKAEAQKEISKRTEEIRRLKQQKADAELNADEQLAARLDADIVKKTDSLTEYTKSKNLELENLRNSLRNSNEFYNKLYKVIERVAENEGLSVILSLPDDRSILWYSNSVDVTDKVISELDR